MKYKSLNPLVCSLCGLAFASFTLTAYAASESTPTYSSSATISSDTQTSQGSYNGERDFKLRKKYQKQKDALTSNSSSTSVSTNKNTLLDEAIKTN